MRSNSLDLWSSKRRECGSLLGLPLPQQPRTVPHSISSNVVRSLKFMLLLRKFSKDVLLCSVDRWLMKVRRFLCVYLQMKEFDECIDRSQVENALKTIPEI